MSRQVCMYRFGMVPRYAGKQVGRFLRAGVVVWRLCWRGSTG